MKVHCLAGMAACLVATPLWAAPGADEDVKAIRAIETRQEAAWNAHDARAYAQLFTPDADIVNVLGWWWKSPAELEQKLAIAFSFVFAHSRLHTDAVNIRFLTPDVAIAHVEWSMTGAASPDASGKLIPQKGIQTQTLFKTAQGWRIAAFQNTNAVPERAFPTRPQ